jgi:hypothetical protein
MYLSTFIGIYGGDRVDQSQMLRLMFNLGWSSVSYRPVLGQYLDGDSWLEVSSKYGYRQHQDRIPGIPDRQRLSVTGKEMSARTCKPLKSLEPNQGISFEFGLRNLKDIHPKSRLG